MLTFIAGLILGGVVGGLIGYSVGHGEAEKENDFIDRDAAYTSKFHDVADRDPRPLA